MKIFDEENKEVSDDQSDKKKVEEVNSEALTQLMSITNEDGKPKYATIEEGIKALASSQEYIPSLKKEKEQLEAELAELKAKQESSESVEQIVEKLLKERKPEQSTDQQIKGLSEEDVANLIRREQEAMIMKNNIAANEEKVTQALTEKYGSAEKAKEAVAAKAKSLGISSEKLGSLASESPEVVIQLFNEGTKPSSPITSSDVNTSQFLKAKEQGLEAPERSMLSGVSAKDQEAYMKKVKDHVYKQLGVTS